MTMRATWQGSVIAESDRTIVIEGNHYFPLEDVNEDYLEGSDHHSICPWKGRASYFHVIVDGERNPDAAWYYPKPTPLARKVKGRVAFWHGVDVVEVPNSADASARSPRRLRRGA
jgi:uncharacterized protein (DUF427 family)